MTKMLCQFVVLAAMMAFVNAQAGELTEDQKRSEFAKAYAAAKPEERMAAVQLLKGCKEDASFLWLVRVANVDVDEAVRLSAYNLVSEWDDPMGKMEKVLLDIFRNEKNRENRISMCQVWPKLKTKTMAIEEAIKFFNTFSYPETTNRDFNNNNNNGGGGNSGGVTGRRSAESIAEERKKFTDVLAVVNALTGQSFAPSNKARGEIKKWWTMYKPDFLKADAETFVKLRNDAQAAASNAAKKE